MPDPTLAAHCAQFVCLPVWNSYVAFSPTYPVFLFFGIASIILFSARMIGEPTYLSDEKKDPIGLFPPKYLTFQAKYRLASLSYCALLILGYLVLTIVLDQPGVDLPTWGKLRPTPLPEITATENNVTVQIKNLDQTIPLLLAFMLIGLMPRIPIVEKYERRLREWVHEVFLIPNLGRATAARIVETPIHEDALTDTGLAPAEASFAEQELGFKFFETIERMTFLLGIPDKIRIDRTVGDSEHITSYLERFETATTLLEQFRKDVRATMDVVIAGLPEQERGVALLSERLKVQHHAIQSEMRFLSLVVAGSILRRTRSDAQVARALSRIGLVQESDPVPTTPGDTAILVAFPIAIGYWLWEMVRAAIIEGLWRSPGVLGRFSENTITATIDGVVAYILSAIILFAALSYQLHRKGQSGWTGAQEKGFGRRTEYLKLVLMSFALATAVNFLHQALWFGYLSVPEKGTTWSHLVIWSFVLGMRAALFALLVAFLVDREEVKASALSVAPALGLIAFLVLLAGFVIGYMGAQIQNTSLVKGTFKPPEPLSDAQWVGAFLVGLQSLWMALLILMSFSKGIQLKLGEVSARFSSRWMRMR